MEIKELEVFSEASNYGVVRMPGRQYPGCVVQGDSLSILLSYAESIRSRLAGTHDQELIDVADELVELLAGRLDHYEAVLTRHGMSLPYSRKARGG